ncbi:Mce protein [[Mycobacterium] zoologicum]|uniref:Mce protein n=1 Tax=[Mycobacterium] zoologicum TaxID=2872311 RepID=UPI002B8B2FC7|nr:Mce protein [Mycolicibacter sp. MYC101]MEB3065087.1 Mce protein [Mycolicibacter sp. MYC101]
MAEHADPPDSEVSESAAPETSPTSAGCVEEGSSESIDETSEATGAPEPEPLEISDECVDDVAAVDDDADGNVTAKKPVSPVRLAMVLGLIMVVALTALAGWLGFRGYQARQAQQQREFLVQVARQGALNLTTIDWEHVDADVQRILDSATGTFYDDFSQRSDPFVQVIEKTQAKSVGTITEAGLESQSSDEAQVLVAVSVKTSNLGAIEQEPRHWRMRISVQKVGAEPKISNVAFVP